METREEITAWIRAVLKVTGWNPSRWAKAAGVSASTITRLLKDPECSLPNSRTLTKLRDAAADKAPGEVPGALQGIAAVPARALDPTLMRRTTVAVLQALGERQGGLAAEDIWSVLETVYAVFERQAEPPTEDLRVKGS